jgi:hypothetical protein
MFSFDNIEGGRETIARSLLHQLTVGLSTFWAFHRSTPTYVTPSEFIGYTSYTTMPSTDKSTLNWGYFYRASWWLSKVKPVEHRKHTWHPRPRTVWAPVTNDFISQLISSRFLCTSRHARYKKRKLVEERSNDHHRSNRKCVSWQRLVLVHL